MTVAELLTHVGNYVPPPPSGDETLWNKQIRYLNQASERIFNAGKWDGTVRRVVLTIGSSGYIDLPDTYDGILSLVDEETGTPREIFADDLGFQSGGPGVPDEDDGHYAILDQRDQDVRKYKIPATIGSEGENVIVKAKLAPIAVAGSSDSIYPVNIGAWKNAVMALASEDEHDNDRAEIQWSKCFQLLNQELKARRAGSKKTINVHPWGLRYSGGVPSFY